MGESWSREEGWGCRRDEGQGGGAVLRRRLVSSHGSGVQLPASGKIQGVKGEAEW
jgi:hypothetical protein